MWLYLFTTNRASNETFLKRRHFLDVWYGAQAVGESASHEISHMRRRFSALPPSFIFFNRAAMGRARFIIYPWFINRAAIGRARFIIYTWFFFLFSFSAVLKIGVNRAIAPRVFCNFRQPAANFESLNLKCLLAKRC